MGGKRQSVTPGYLLEAGSNGGKRVRLGIPDQGHPTQRRWKRLRPPSSEGVGSEVGVPRKSFSSTWGWVILHLGTPGTCLRRENRRRWFRLVSPGEGTSARALVHFQ